MRFAEMTRLRVTMTSQPPTRPRIKRRTATPILLTVFITATVCVADGVASAKTDLPQVTYQLSGSSPVAEYISFQTDTGQQQQANVKLPWSTQFTAFGGEVYVLSAQSPGSITCTILVDQKVVSQATANGQPARTVCSH
jgi:Mycobacterium membrane protein